MSTRVEAGLDGRVDVVNPVFPAQLPPKFPDLAIENAEEPGPHVGTPFEARSALYHHLERRLSRVLGFLEGETRGPRGTQDLLEVGVRDGLDGLRIARLEMLDEPGVVESVRSAHALR